MTEKRDEAKLVRMSKTELARLEAEADRRGIGVSTLMRMTALVACAGGES